VLPVTLIVAFANPFTTMPDTLPFKVTPMELVPLALSLPEAR